jgi:peptide/nickel transport system ATP-binding protein
MASDSEPGYAAARSVILELEGLTVETATGDLVLEGVDLTLRRGEVLGVVGESGSGKTTTALALLGYASPGTRIASGKLRLAGESMVLDNEAQARAQRGRVISYVPQNPGAALNPSTRIADAVARMLEAHTQDGSSEASIEDALVSVGFPDDPAFRRRYPHQLSGGQQQRVCIAVALACEPPIIVLDEPTTGLDVITESHILKELARLREEHEVSMIYVTHDLAVVAELADRIAVMYAGRIVEDGPAEAVLGEPRHPYTRGLLASIVDHAEPRELRPLPGVAVAVGDRPPGCAFAPRCSLRIPECASAVPPLAPTGRDGHLARCLRSADVIPLSQRLLVSAENPRSSESPVLEVSRLKAEHKSRTGSVVAASDVSFAISRGQCLALVGTSGSGKTTIARAIAGLHLRSGGDVRLRGEQLALGARKRTREQRRLMQIIFQNPGDALNPRRTVGFAIERVARVLRKMTAAEARAESERLLDVVRLPRRAAGRFPAELSGGERQRVAIARALAADPVLLICDEITSALDVSLQAAIIELLSDLRAQFGLAMLFITHDLGVVTMVADDVLVLDQSVVCESGTTRRILTEPQASYTKSLLDAAPSLSRALERRLAATVPGGSYGDV